MTSLRAPLASVVALLAAAPSVVFAQSEPVEDIVAPVGAPVTGEITIGQPDAPQEPSSLPPLSVDTAVCSRPSVAAYDGGVDALHENDLGRAVRLFELSVRLCPTHPFARELLRITRERAMIRANSSAQPLQPFRSSDLDAHSTFTHVEFVTWQALGGLNLATTIAVAAGGGNAAVIGGSLLLGAAAGGVAGYLLGGRLRQGQALAIDSGMFWGIGVGWLSALAGSNSIRGGAIAIPSLVGQVLGTGIGAAVAFLVDPSGGRLATANSSAFWIGGSTMLLALGLGAGAITAPGFAAVGLLGLTGSYVLGASLWETLGRPSRTRMAYIDLAAIGGAAVGGGVALIAATGTYGSTSVLVATASVALGSLIGLGIGIGVTRSMDRPAQPRPAAPLASAYVIPMGPGNLPGLTLGASF